MKDEKEKEYQEWLEKNKEFIKRFVSEFVEVNVDKESDYYGSEWYAANIWVN